MKLAWYGLCTIAVLLYGTLTHSSRSSVARYHHIRKPESCGDIDRTCVYEVTYVNRHGHPNHCWNFMKTPTGIHFPNVNNETYPNRTGYQSVDLAPYSTSTSVLYLVSGVIIMVFAHNDTPWVRDATGISVFFMVVGMSSFAFHRSPSDTTRHNDWAMISVLLTYLGMSAFEIHGPYTSGIKLVAAGIVFQISYDYVHLSLYIGAAIMLSGMAVMLVRAAMVRSFKPEPRMVQSIVVALGCVVAAVFSKYYGNAEPNPALPFLAYDAYHHRAECANDQNSEHVEDISHGNWHIYGALAGLVYALPVVGCNALTTLEMAAVLCTAAATAFSAMFNHGKYSEWMGLTYGSAVLWIVVSAGEWAYNRKSSVGYSAVKNRGVIRPNSLYFNTKS